MDIPFDKIKGFAATTIFSILGGTIASGFLFIFIFERELFLTLDKWLLYFLAPSITLPLLIYNIGILIINTTKDGSEREENKLHRIFTGSVFFANLITSIIFYIAILLGYFFNIQTKMAVAIIVILEILIGISIWFRPSKSTTK